MPNLLSAILLGAQLASAIPVAQVLDGTGFGASSQASDVAGQGNCATLPSTGSCNPADLTPDNWVNQCIDPFLLNTLEGTPPTTAWPAVVAFADSPSSNFGCNDFNNPSTCSFPNNDICHGSDGLSAFQFGFINQAFINIYQNLANMNTAIQNANNDLVNSNFIDSMVSDVGRVKLPISRDTLFTLVDLSLSFVPIPGAEVAGAAEDAVKGIRKILKVFKKFDKKLVSQGENGQANAENTENQQPDVLKGMLSNAISDMQQTLIDQLNDVFHDDHTADGKDFFSQLLKDGVHLAPVTSVQDYQNIMEQNLKTYLISQMMANNGMILIVDSITAACDGPDINDGNGHCRRFRYPIEGFFATAASADHPNNFGNVESYGVNIADMAQNAVDCAAVGDSFLNVDFDQFLESDSLNLPPCLFGIPIMNQ